MTGMVILLPFATLPSKERRFIMRFDILCNPDSSNRCEAMVEVVRAALEQSGVEAEVHLFRDRRKMIDYRVYIAPALLVDDTLRIAGRIPERSEIMRILAERPRYFKRLAKVA